MLVKAIQREIVDVSRIAHRATQPYFAILFDDNNRKPIVHLCFNSLTNKYIVTFDKDKKETRHNISSLDDISVRQWDQRISEELFTSKV